MAPPILYPALSSKLPSRRKRKINKVSTLHSTVSKASSARCDLNEALKVDTQKKIANGVKFMIWDVSPEMCRYLKRESALDIEMFDEGDFKSVDHIF